MNSDEIWLLQLWSGTFGASIGAIAAAGVALLVVWRTNRHQSKLAALARRQAAALAEEQLATQERSLRKQLDEQRAEASKARYFEAIGTFVATVEAGRSGFTSVRDYNDVFAELEAARVRMALDSDSPELMAELVGWPLLIRTMCRAASFEHAERIADGAPIRCLRATVPELTRTIEDWPHASADERVALLSLLRETRSEAWEVMHEYKEVQMSLSERPDIASLWRATGGLG